MADQKGSAQGSAPGAGGVRTGPSVLDGDDRWRFIRESNRIEGIHRLPVPEEIGAHEWLWSLDAVTPGDIERFVFLVAGPGSTMRRKTGQDVRVGRHVPPKGGEYIEAQLAELLAYANGGGADPHTIHVRYELLHPFMDGNGRSGRALWAWQMLRNRRDPFSLGFLHTFYYQALDASREA